ncbi:DHH family phosphoesterase [Butyrivibrio sp. AE3004]|uniref:DHH family phosphoesterase n=1 Tax=Butyrivibrio sp. AE3004 TaxID=1506994 RepID=UPI000494D8BB|nr:DHH family phosphoesterase [Butyrivibrio sp. AE3004]
MKLSNLLSFSNIVIQCHDNPDADALASGYALYKFFSFKGKRVEFIYRGQNKIQKSNLLMMLEDLDIPVKYKPDYGNIPELLITVDCQYGQRNVTTTTASNIAVIDHHQISGDLPPLSEVKSNVGSASTVVWNMIMNEDAETAEFLMEDIKLTTALYYGLFTDTNKLSEVFHPLDRDMIEELKINKIKIIKMSNSNLSYEELMIIIDALQKHNYNSDAKYAVMKSAPCDPNILGAMSDLLLETAGIDTCVAYFETSEQIKFSVRSCIKEVHADELAKYLVDDIPGAGGGGHLYKAGGSYNPMAFQNVSIDTLIRERMHTYFCDYEVINSKDGIKTDDMKLYSKKSYHIGYVKMTDLFPLGTNVSARAYGGDIEETIKKDEFFLISIMGEVYPTKGETLTKTYTLSEDPYICSLEYEPNVKNLKTGEKKPILPYAKIASARPDARIYAKRLDKTVKLFTEWDINNYVVGVKGDYLAAREDNLNDIYIIKSNLFDKLYEEV